MVAGRPATIQTPIAEQIRAIIDRGFILSKDYPTIVQLWDECQKLIKVDAVAGYSELSYLAQLCGNIDDAVSYARNAVKLTTQRKELGLITEMCVLGNLGYFARLAQLANERIKPETGWFGQYYTLLLASGQVRPLVDRYQDLPRMGIAQPANFPQAIVASRAVLDEAGISDVQIGHALDAAGQIMRDHKVIHLGTGPDVMLTRVGNDHVVHFMFALPLTPEQVGEANWDLAMMLAQSERILPQLHVSFGVQ